MAVSGATVTLNSVKRVTDAAGKYTFTDINTGLYAFRVEKEPWYEPHEKALTLTTPGEDYTEDVGLSLKLYIKVGLPVAAVVGVVGGVYVTKRPEAPRYEVPPGFELVPKVPPGYRLVRE